MQLRFVLDSVVFDSNVSKEHCIANMLALSEVEYAKYVLQKRAGLLSNVDTTQNRFSLFLKVEDAANLVSDSGKVSDLINIEFKNANDNMSFESIPGISETIKEMKKEKAMKKMRSEAKKTKKIVLAAQKKDYRNLLKKADEAVKRLRKQNENPLTEYVDPLIDDD